jgi:hypothetical protein
MLASSTLSTCACNIYLKHLCLHHLTAHSTHACNIYLKHLYLHHLPRCRQHIQAGGQRRVEYMHGLAEDSQLPANSVDMLTFQVGGVEGVEGGC